MSLTITVLGSSGSYASATNPCTGYLVRSPDATVLLDAGPGVLGPLQRHISIDELDAVVLTHAHPDHWMELPVLRNVILYFHQRESPLPVYGTAQTRDMHDAVTVSRRAGRPFEWTTITETSSLTIGDLAWRFARTDHPIETLAPRIDWQDRSMAFTADCGPNWSYAELGTDIDLALSDASHLAEWEGRGIPHMSAREAGIRAREAGIPRLVITHLAPGMDPATHRAEAAAAYGGPVEVALPGATFIV